MRIIVCGAGQVGYGIAERLAAENHDVSVIDSSSHLISKIRDTLDVRGFVGHGAHPTTLARAGADNADMIIAVTLYDEVNMIACQVAHSIFNIPTKVARIRSQSYVETRYKDLFSSDNLPIDVIISPEVEVGETVTRRIALPGAEEVVSFADETVTFVAIKCEDDCPVINTPMRQLTDLFPDLGAVVVGYARNGQVHAANSDDQLLAQDIAYVIVKRGTVRRALSIFGHEEPDARRIVIAGGGTIGSYVARRVQERMNNARVKVIEASRDRASEIAEELKNTVVLHGNSLEQSVLMEANIENSDLIVALTDDDQSNILTSVMAKRLGCKSSMALLNNASYHDFTQSLNIDAHINPRSVTLSSILQYVRRGRIRSVYSVFEGAAEIIDAEAQEGSVLLDAPLSQIDIPDGVRIGAICRDEEVILPTGDTQIIAGDRVVLFAERNSIRSAEEYFRTTEYFG